MDKLEISGPCILSGEVDISSAKNACLPIMIGSLLNRGETILEDIPNLRDTRTLKKILESLGVRVCIEGKSWVFKAESISSQKADYELVRKMRASVLVLGPLLSRFGHARVSLPGGCAIGTRPVDLHLEALKEMGASIEIEDGYICAEAKKLKGAEIFLSFPSVGATENIMMAAVYAQGRTSIENAAKEPEIVDLACFLQKMGVQIKGAGSSKIEIIGVGEIIDKKVSHRCIPDRVEAATFLMAALATESKIKINGVDPEALLSILETLKKMGASFEVGSNFIKTSGEKLKRGAQVETAPFPGFPTDAQAQLTSLACGVRDTTLVKEVVFENRFMHIPELVRMGADIQVSGNTACIKGGSPLSAAPVMCTDLRASAALVIAGLMANGVTTINRIYHLDRGYDHIERKLTKLGAEIRRIS